MSKVRSPDGNSGTSRPGNNINCECSLSWLVESNEYKGAVVDGYMVKCNGTPLPEWTTDDIC
jgi:hypothetical protein